MKRSLILLVLAVLFLFEPTKAQNWTEFESTVWFQDNNETEYYNPLISYGSINRSDSSMFGFYFFGLASEAWGEGYAGVVLTPATWCEFYAGVGLETAPDDPYRYNVGAWLGTGDWTLYQSYETGGTGFWYTIHLDYAGVDGWTIGAMSRRYYGTGLKIEKKISDHFSFWVAPLYDAEDNNPKVMTVLKVTF